MNPIPVLSLTFVSPQDGPGLSVATSCTSSTEKRKSNHTLEYWPWLRSFRVSFEREKGKAPDVGFIPESRVMCWRPAGEVDPPKRSGRQRPTEAPQEAAPPTEG